MKGKTMELNESVHGVKQLNFDGIAEVKISEPMPRYRGEYAERPTRYKIQLKGESRWRRVYAKPIGNVAVVYIKTRGAIVYCETALDTVLHCH